MALYKRIAFLLFYINISTAALCQLPYTLPVYAIRKDSAVKYGTDLNFCNRIDSLKLTIYKPVGDNNSDRPAIILVHGGGFVSYADYNSTDMDQMAQEFARRGYVAASIDYREGFHLKAYGNAIPGLTVPLGISNAAANYAQWSSAFASDSSEVIRAVYRAQQDVKAAVRFMKLNHIADSTNICKMFLGGHSAGAIAVLTAAFLDNSTEKPIAAYSNTTVNNPNWTSDFLQTVFNNGPENQDDLVYATFNPGGYNYDAPSCYNRPDLGAVHGNVNSSGGYDASVLGVAALAGGLIDTNILAGTNKPALFLYHIESDAVVPFNTAKPFDYANLLFVTPPNSEWPLISGSNRINSKLNGMGYPAPKTFWVYNGPDVNIATTHSILPGIAFVSDSIAKFFAAVLTQNTNCAVLLPVSFFNFKVKVIDCVTSLSWNGGDANTVYQYEICRSKNGWQFETIKSVKSVAGIEAAYIYDFKQHGAAYYKIKIIQANGSVTESETIHVRNGCENDKHAFVYPNPVEELLTINNAGINSTVRLLDVSGRVLKTVVTKNNNITINVKDLAPAIYIVQIIWADKKNQITRIRKT